MIGVKVKHKNLEKALLKFKRKIKDSGILEHYKRKMFYQKPSEKRKDEKKAAIERQKKIDELYD